MQKTVIALILILLGLIVIAFPFLGMVSAALLSGILVILLGIGLLLAGIAEISEGAGLGIAISILGIIALVLGFGFIFSPALFAWIAGLIIWIIGILIIAEGISRIISKTGASQCGVKDIIIGIIILFVGLFLATYTWIIGILIGLWLLTSGLRMLFNERSTD